MIINAASVARLAPITVNIPNSWIASRGLMVSDRKPATVVSPVSTTGNATWSSVSVTGSCPEEPSMTTIRCSETT